MNEQRMARELVAVARELTARVKQLKLKDAVTGGSIRVEVFDGGEDLPVEVSISVAPSNVGATLYLNRDDISKLARLLR